MNVFKESSSSIAKTNGKPKSKRSRQTQSKTTKSYQDNTSLMEPLLSSSENSNHSIELQTINSDDDGDDNNNNNNHNHNQRQSNIRHIRSRRTKQQSVPAAHGGGSILIVEKPIRPQETIQAFAIRYRVPVCFFMLSFLYN